MARTSGGVGGGSVVKTFPFAYNTPDLLTGATVYSAKAGEYILGAWFRISTALGDVVWNSTLANGDVVNAAFLSDNGWGWVSDASKMGSGGAAGLTAQTGNNLDNIAFNNPQVVPVQESAGSNQAYTPILFTADDDVVVIVSQDGTSGTTPSSFDSTTPPPVLPFVVATGVNDEYAFLSNYGVSPAPDTFTVAPSLGGYATTADLATALNAAIDSGAHVFSATYGTWADDGAGNLSLTLLHAGGNGSAVSSGANDITPGLGLSVSMTAGGTGGNPGATEGSAVLYLIIAA